MHNYECSILVTILWSLCVHVIHFVFSLRASEDVQYFQFDNEGNMFVFGPGSGFTGPCVKVAPGFELADTTQYSVFSGETSKPLSMSEVSMKQDIISVDFSSEVIGPTPFKRF